MELRERIAAVAYPGLAADDVVSAVPEEALYILGRVLLRPGDRVIATFPGYQSLYEIASAVGAQVVRWTPEETANGWWFDPGRLAELARDGARAIVVNFPHNPTGALPSAAEWQAVVADRRARRRDARLGRDVPRARVRRASASLTPAAVASGARRLDRRALEGVRPAGPARRLARDARPLALEAAQALQGLHDDLRERAERAARRGGAQERTAARRRCREIVAANRPLAGGVPGTPVTPFAWRAPLAGPIAFVRFHPGEALAFCERLATSAGVMLLPSTVFEWGDSHVRFGFGRRSLPEALAALEKAL